MPKAKVNGIELYYESHGEGPAIVFAHGRGGNHMSWWQQVPAFVKEYHCITFDHRGWGISEEPAGGPGRSAFVQDLKELLDHLEVDSAFLVAQSMGGLTCLGFAVAYPERVNGLVLGDTTGGVGDPPVLELLRHVNPPELGIARTLSPGFRSQHPNRTFLYEEIAWMNPEITNIDIGPAFRDPDGPKGADLANLGIPTLLIVGKEELVFPVHVMQQVHQLIPGSRLEIVAGAGHSTHFEQPAEFNRLVSGFFAGILAGQPVAATGD